MLPTLGALFDRILANRLNKWAGVGDEQTAFQKGKSTILQLFTIRILIDIARKTKTTIYIGYFDLEKAFDKVSRFMLLKKLIALGIGNHMLQALKRLYSGTMCVLSLGREKSDPSKKVVCATQKFHEKKGCAYAIMKSRPLNTVYFDVLFYRICVNNIASLLSMQHWITLT